MSVKFPFFGGGFWGGGGECRFYFYGRADFSEKCRVHFCCRLAVSKVRRCGHFHGGGVHLQVQEAKPGAQNTVHPRKLRGASGGCPSLKEEKAHFAASKNQRVRRTAK